MRGRTLLCGGLLLGGLVLGTLAIEPACAAGKSGNGERMAPSQKKDQPAASKTLEGTWTKVSVETDGNKTACDFTVVINKDKISWVDMSALDLKYTLDADNKRLDCVPLDGPSKGKPVHGIYRLDGDTLTICLGGPGNERPTEFTTKRNCGRLLIVLKKKSADAAVKTESIQGAWEMTMEEGTPPIKVKIAIAISEEQVSFGALKFLNVTYKIDPSKAPKQIDWVPIEGPKKGQVLPGIYRLNGDTLTICLGEIGGKRPTEFSDERTNAGGGLIIVFQKSKGVR